jgi:hypothetical protein
MNSVCNQERERAINGVWNEDWVEHYGSCGPARRPRKLHMWRFPSACPVSAQLSLYCARDEVFWPPVGYITRQLAGRLLSLSIEVHSRPALSG